MCIYIDQKKSEKLQSTLDSKLNISQLNIAFLGEKNNLKDHQETPLLRLQQ